MNRFAHLLDRLAYEPGRNNKLRLITNYFRETPDPDRGYALAAFVGALSFRHAKSGLIRDLIAARTDPALFALSYDYVGDLSETVALMWPQSTRLTNTPPPTLSEVVTTLSTLGKIELPAQLARWLDELDETGRWALLKLVTGGMRIGISARLAKTAAAACHPGMSFQEITLGALKEDDSRHLLDNLVGQLPATVHRQILTKTEGNPFFLEEVVRALIADGVLVKDMRAGAWRLARPVAALS